MKYCASCGAGVEAKVRFCPNCGHPTRPSEIHAPAPSSADPASEAPRSHALPPIAMYLLAVACVLLLAGSAYWWSQRGNDEERDLSFAEAPPSDPDSIRSWFQTYEDDFLSGEENFYITGTARVRDFPTSEETQALDTFEARRPVRGRWVRGRDPTTRWLKLSSGGYVWEGNIGDAATIYPAGIGGLFVDTPYSEIRTVFSPDGIYGYGPEYCESYMALENTYSAMFESNRATAFVTSDPSFVTQKGARVGMSVTELQAAYDGMLERRENIYGGADYFLWASPNRGMRFYVGSNATVETIFSGTKSIEYVEGCL